LFFTVNLLKRKNNDLLVRHIQALREAVKLVKTRHPFEIHAWLVMPERFHGK
jgi:putative transposase